MNAKITSEEKTYIVSRTDLPEDLSEAEVVSIPRRVATAVECIQNSDSFGKAYMNIKWKILLDYLDNQNRWNHEYKNNK